MIAISSASLKTPSSLPRTTAKLTLTPFPSLKHITKFALVLDFAEIRQRINIASLLESWRRVGAALAPRWRRVGAALAPRWHRVE